MAENYGGTNANGNDVEIQRLPNTNIEVMQPSEVETQPSSASSYLHYFTGTAKPLDNWLQNKHVSLRLLVGSIRAFGQPIFINNPFSGLIILAALIVQSYWRFVNGLLCLLTGQLTAFVLKQDKTATENGSIAFNALLTGLVVTAFSGKEDWYGYLVFPILILGFYSTILSSALGKFLNHFNLPALNLPFNIAAFSFIVATGVENSHFPQAIGGNNSAETTEFINWLKILEAVPKGVGQCYGCDNTISGVLITFALLISSPTVFLHAIIGSVLGIFTGLGLAVPNEEIYNGSWGYNSVLVCCSLGGVFYVLTIASHCLALAGAIFAALTASAMGTLLAPIPAPFIAFPFCFTTLVFLLISSDCKQIIRMPLSSITYPEDHRKRFKPSAVGE